MEDGTKMDRCTTVNNSYLSVMSNHFVTVLFLCILSGIWLNLTLCYLLVSDTQDHRCQVERGQNIIHHKQDLFFFVVKFAVSSQIFSLFMLAHF